MSIRSTHIVDDIQRCIFCLLESLSETAPPWTDWNVILGYPEATVFSQFIKPFIYVLEPVVIGRYFHQGGGKTTRLWRMSIGAWDHRKIGGPEELNIISSYLIDLFDDPKSVNSDIKFSVTLGNTEYSDVNLLSMGILVDRIEGPQIIETEDEKEFRCQFELVLIA